MPVGKKMVVVLSVVITGVGASMFFRKDASPLWFWSRTSDDPFAQQVERRVGGQHVWTATPPAVSQFPAATAAIAQPGSEATPGYSHDARPVGSLLAPIEGVRDDLGSGRYDAGASYEPRGVAPTTDGELRHRVEDGDTLTQLAARYLGSADEYWRIYQLNRYTLASPDLLPIGTVLRIPARQSSAGLESTTGMMPLPPRPGS